MDITLENIPVNDNPSYSILMIIYSNDGLRLWKEVYRSDVIYNVSKTYFILIYFIRYNFEELIPMIYKFEIPMKIRIRLYEVNDMKHPFDGISFYF